MSRIPLRVDELQLLASRWHARKLPYHAYRSCDVSNCVLVSTGDRRAYPRCDKRRDGELSDVAWCLGARVRVVKVQGWSDSVTDTSTQGFSTEDTLHGLA